MSHPKVALAHYWVSREPRILHCAAYHASAREVGDALPPGRTHFLATDWYCRTPETRTKWVMELLEIRPEIKFYQLAQSTEIAHGLRKVGPFPVEVVNQNSLIDERVFRPGGASPEFDAIYNARPLACKRHELASAIDSLLLICRATSAATDAEFDRVRKSLPQAVFAGGNDTSRISIGQVVDHLRKARVGLCLSAVEGAMYVSAEYALCGLPVVTTPSVGGRDAVFAPQYTRTVPPAPETIAQAVRELKILNPDPKAVRQAALDRLLPHRRRFINLCQRIYDEEGVGRDFSRDFYGTFVDKMLTWGHLSH